MIPVAEMTQIENTTFSKKAGRMWGFDLHSWEQVMLWSLGAAALAAFAVTVSTTAVVLLQKEESEAARHELELYKLDAGKKISAAEAVGQAAQADIAKANAQIADSTARSKEAELKLEQLRERMKPREIKGERFLKLLEGRPKAPVEVVFVRDDPECFRLAMQIRDWLKQAKWDIDDAVAIAAPDTPRLGKYTSSMGVGGQPSGVTVVQRATSQDDFERERHDPFDPNAPIDTPAKALSLALGDSLGSISGSMSFDTGTPGVLRVVVGPK